MQVTVDGVAYDDALHFVRFKKPWTKAGLVYLPLYTLERKYLCLFSEGMCRDINACHRDLLRLDNVCAIRPRAKV